MRFTPALRFPADPLSSSPSSPAATAGPSRPPSQSIPRSISGKPPSPSAVQSATASLPRPIKRAVQRTIPVTPPPNPAAEEYRAQRSKSLLQSFKSLTPNTRIAFGVCIAIVGVLGLYWDRFIETPSSNSSNGENRTINEKPLVSVRMVDRKL